MLIKYKVINILKLIMILCLIMINIIIFSVAVYADEWVEDSGKWKYKKGDNFVVGKVEYIDGQPYSFDNNGNLEIGIVDINGNYYFFGLDGEVMKNVTVKYSGQTYLTDKYGKLVSYNPKNVSYDFDNSDGNLEDVLRIHNEEVQKSKNEEIQKRKEEIQNEKAFQDFLNDIKDSKKNMKIEFEKLSEGADVIINADLSLTRIDNNEKVKSMWVELRYKDAELDGGYTYYFKYYYDENGNRVISPTEIGGKYYLFEYDVDKDDPLFIRKIGVYKNSVDIRTYNTELEKYMNKDYDKVTYVENKKPITQNSLRPISDEMSSFENEVKTVALDKNDERVLYRNFINGSFIAPKELKLPNGTIYFLDAKLKANRTEDETEKLYNETITVQYKAVPFDVKTENMSFNLLYGSNVKNVVVNNYYVEETIEISLGDVSVQVNDTSYDTTIVENNKFYWATDNDILYLANTPFAEAYAKKGEISDNNYSYGGKYYASNGGIWKDADFNTDYIKKIIINSDIKPEKGADIFSGFAKLENIENLNLIDLTSWDNLNSLFSGCNSLKMINMGELKVKDIKSVSHMFYECNGLENVIFGNFDFSNVETTECMFERCSSLKNIDMKDVNFAKLNNMSRMFADCTSLEKVEFPDKQSFYPRNLSSLFEGCKKLTYVDFALLNGAVIDSISFMFDGCESIENIDMKLISVNEMYSLSSLFKNCKNLKTVKFPLLEFNYYMDGKIKLNMDEMFNGCENLQEVDFTSLKSCYNATYKFDNIFNGCNIEKVLISDENIICNKPELQSKLIKQEGKAYYDVKITDELNKTLYDQKKLTGTTILLPDIGTDMFGPRKFVDDAGNLYYSNTYVTIDKDLRLRVS